MQKLEEQLRGLAQELLETGQVDVVLGFTHGELPYQAVPFVAKSKGDAEKLVFNHFCEKALSKYLVDDYFQTKRVAVILKGCDYRALNLLLKEERVKREQLYLIGLDCPGIIRRTKLEEIAGDLTTARLEFNQGAISAETKDGTKEIAYGDVVSSFCRACQLPGPEEADVDSKLSAAELDLGLERGLSIQEIFPEIVQLEKKPLEERFAFWEEYLNKCRRCYSCREACPVCTCIKCIFDREDPRYMDKAIDQLPQHQFYHLIRAFHVADRCVGCGECERVCPERIPLHLLHKKIGKDIGELYGSYEPGIDTTIIPPLSRADSNDPDPFTKEER